MPMNTCAWIVPYPDDPTKVGLVEGLLITAIDINDLSQSKICLSNESWPAKNWLLIWNNNDTIYPDFVPVINTKYYTDGNGSITSTNTGYCIGTSLDGITIKLNWTFTL